MSNSIKLIETLKRQLKVSGITYRELGKRLELSESAIKQMFSSANFSLKRLDEICESLNLNLTELIKLTSEFEPRIKELDQNLEGELVKNPKLLLVAYCLVNHWTVKDILDRYAINQTELIQLLVKLDRMKLIELLPENKVRLLITNSFKWQKNGPIESFFKSQVQNEFLKGDFQTNNSLQLIKNGDITKRGQRRLIERMDSIGTLFDDISREERNTSLKERAGTTMILAIRNWQFTIFSKFERCGKN